MRGDEDSRLPRRIASSDENDIAAFAQRRLDRRRPVRDAGCLEAVEGFDLWPPVTRARRDHNRPSINRNASVECHAVQRWLRAIEFADRDRHRKSSTEFLSLKKCARRKRLAGDAGRKSQIVLDPRGCGRLATERAAINNQNGEPLRWRIPGSSEGCRVRANYDHVVSRARLDIWNYSQPYPRFGMARP